MQALTAFKHNLSMWKRILLFVIAIVIQWLSIEFAFYGINFINSFLVLPLGDALIYICLGMVLNSVIMLGVWCFCQRRIFGVITLNVVLVLISIVVDMCFRYRGYGFTADDILAIPTLFSVASHYTIAFTTYNVMGLLLMCVSNFFFWLSLEPSKLDSADTVFKNVLVGAVVFALAVTYPYDAFFGTEISPFLRQAFERCGPVGVLVDSFKHGSITEPDGYDADIAKAVLDKYHSDKAEVVKDAPNVVVIQCESFADTTACEGVDTFLSEPFDGTMTYGLCAVSVICGGTCNSEYEFLTGTPLSLYDIFGAYPYTKYDFKTVKSIVPQLNDLGYATTYMHPNFSMSWGRNRVVPDLGFDTYLSLDDFEITDDDLFREYVRDDTTYSKVLELLKTNSEPQFVFDVTIADHGSYRNTAGESIDGLIDYNSCVEHSMQALSEFLKALRELDEETYVVFYGDHYPEIVTYMDYYLGSYRCFETPYMIWSNQYDDAPEQLDIPLYAMSSYLFDTLKFPMSAYQKYEIDLLSRRPLLHSWYYVDEAGEYQPVRSDNMPEEFQEFAYVNWYDRSQYVKPRSSFF